MRERTAQQEVAEIDSATVSVIAAPAAVKVETEGPAAAVPAGEDTGAPTAAGAPVLEVPLELNDLLGTLTHRNDESVGAAAEAAEKEVVENGLPFVKVADGSTTFGEIHEDSGLSPPP